MQLTATGGAADTGRLTALLPVVIDFPGTPIGGLDTLSDIENSGYRLRRIVGKIFIGIRQTTVSTAAGVWLCAAGFIILKTDSVGTPLDATLTQYDHFAVDNDDSPWIWRREWFLQDGGATGGIDDGSYPFSNCEYGSASDGPHIDQKTARIVTQNERLFFVVTVTNIGAGSNQDPTDFDIVCTPRVLASMRTSSGNRRNASR